MKSLREAHNGAFDPACQAASKSGRHLGHHEPRSSRCPNIRAGLSCEYPASVYDSVHMQMNGITLPDPVREDDPPELRAAFRAHLRTSEVDEDQLLAFLQRAASGDSDAIEWVRAREKEHADAARAFRELVSAADRANLIAVADAAPLVGIDLVTLMRRIEARGVGYSLPRGARGPLYLRIEDLERLR